MNVLKEQRSRYATYRLPKVVLSIFGIGIAATAADLCGAGHDAVPLVRFAKELGWWVAVLDQPADATEEFVKRVPSASRGAAVIMSHSYRNDLQLPAGAASISSPLSRGSRSQEPYRTALAWSRGRGFVASERPQRSGYMDRPVWISVLILQRK